MAGALTISTLNDSSGVLATQNGMKGIAKAWVAFNGGGGNTVGVNGSFNVSSVTQTSTGNYSIAFTTAMANANYAAVSNGTWDNTSGNNVALVGPIYNSPNTTTNCFVSCRNTSSQAAFSNYFNYVAVFGA